MLHDNLASLGISTRAYANYLSGLRSIYMLVHLVIAGIVIFKRADERIAAFIAFFLVLLGTTFWPLSEQAASLPEFWRLPRAIANLLMSGSLLIFVLVFPDGRFTPRWTRVFAAVMLGVLVVRTFFPESALNPQNWQRAFGSALSLITLGVMIYVTVYRYTRLSGPIIRQQTKWVVYGVSAAILGFFVAAALPPALGISTDQGTAYGFNLHHRDDAVYSVHPDFDWHCHYPLAPVGY